MTIENANRLAELRRAHGYSQEELSERLNISRQAISKWERAESSPDTDNLIALARLYGVSLDMLLGLKLPEGPQGAAEAEYEVDTAETDVEPTAPKTTPEDIPADEEDDPMDAFDHMLPDPPEEDPLPDGSFYEEQQKAAARERERKLRRFPYPIAVSAAYLVLGACFNLWHPGWLLFLTIPLFYLPQRERTPLRLLGNPVMVTIIYLLLGFECGLWHPGWLVFFLIPLLNAMR